MANGFSAKLDVSEALAGLSALRGPARESLMRRMLVEAGVMLRDAAKSNALVADNKENAERRGVLSASIYLAYEKERSTPAIVRYAVSWNSGKRMPGVARAPHGHLIEFGHWQTHKVYKGADGNWYTNMKAPHESPKWIAARPFLRPALDSRGQAAVTAGMMRGQIEFPKLMQESGQK